MDIHDADYILGEGEKTGFLPESLEKERKIGQRQRDNLRKARFMIQAAHRDTLHSDAWKLTCIKDKSLQSWSYFLLQGSSNATSKRQINRDRGQSGVMNQDWKAQLESGHKKRNHMGF